MTDTIMGVMQVGPEKASQAFSGVQLPSEFQHRVYYRDSTCFELQTQIQRIGEDEKGLFIIPQETIFHPQGGGQPDDEGVLVVNGQEYLVAQLEEEQNGYIKHYIPLSGRAPCLSQGLSLKLSIDPEKRRLYTSYHTAGHLIASLVERRYTLLKATKGNHFPGKGAVVFTRVDGDGVPNKKDYADVDKQEIKELVQESLIRSFNEDLPVRVGCSQAGRRRVQISGFQACACGGTHLKSIGSSVGAIVLKKVAFKNKEGLKFSYTIDAK